MNVVMLLYPGLTQLDLTGPFEVLTRLKELTIHLAWKDTGPVTDGGGLRLLPTVDFAQCPPADILFVPGGPGQLALMDDTVVLDFLCAQAAQARYVTSVCTGSLLLAAAGLLTGYRATCHWLSLEQLALFGCEPVAERVVVDRTRVTGAGVTSGIDFALVLAELLLGRERAEATQLSMEYDPAPPFAAGNPQQAPADLVAQLRERAAGFQTRRWEAARRAATRLGLQGDTDF
ncbi:MULTISPECIES: DJ-1/PfpI family protein [unclassified Azospirillum]|uniref:DJ-1/PfpI family protein n=1 Tax=unclassified Azospirillum TaxID=2630922 RepID=UPI000B73F170|nr:MULTISPECIES: DJ-1/PfpI family protein [unclassified Azospirillum]SNT18681.1 cyclohexyl-isocyanide hydratase [Azospirillum sp. RU38E]SNT30656.1 cyclohexyl-isocyanide hydratase [Azospirillum sp. RU37A]